MQTKRRLGRLRQFGNGGLDPAKGFPRGRRRLGRAPRRIDRIRRDVERREQPPLEAASPRAIEGEVVDHAPDIGSLCPGLDLRRIRDDPQEDVLNHILGEGRAIEDATRFVQVGRAVALKRGHAHRGGRRPRLARFVVR